MVSNLIFRAADASAALEKVQNALGPDAYIIEIKNVGNFVEITASIEEPALRKRNKPMNPRKSLNLAKQKLNRLNPETHVQSRGSAAYVNALDPVPILDDAAFQLGENSEQKDLFAENVFRDPENPKKSLKKPFDSGIQSTVSESAKKIEKIETSTASMESELSSVAQHHAGKSPTENITLPVGPKDQSTFVFGDLLNFGLSSQFIKKEFNLTEFDGSITRSFFTKTLVSALQILGCDSLFEDFGNLVFLGTPGSGKSTICAKLMHHFGTQFTQKPYVLHVTPEKLFEADRLRFHAKMFNFPFSRKYLQDNAELCQGNRQIIELAWDYQMSFANYYAQQHKSYPLLKPFLVIPAEINRHTLIEVLRVCPMVSTVILNKCDFGRFSRRNLMLLYEKGYKIAALSGDRSVSSPLDMADAVMLHGFVEYTLDL